MSSRAALDVASVPDSAHERSQQGSSGDDQGPKIIDANFTEDKSAPTKTEPLEDGERTFYTADMHPSVLNNLYGQALKVLTVAAAFAPAAFVKNPGAALHNATSVMAADAGAAASQKPAMTLGNLKTFLLQHHQRNRAGAAHSPTTSNQMPLVNRKFLEGPGSSTHADSGGPHGPASVKRVKMLRVAHAKEDAALYKQPLGKLFGDYMAPRPSSIAAWDSLIEERISQAYREGQFDNLNGSGQPLDASGAPMKAKSTDAEHKLNPFIDRTEFFLNRIVKSQGYAPPWVEIAKEIDADIATMRSELRSMYREARKPFRETTELQRSVRERGRQQPITARSSDNGNDEVTVHARSRFWSIMRQLLPDTPPPFPPDRRASTPPGTAPTSAPTSLAFHDINARMLSWAETRSRLIDAKIDRYNMSTPSGFGHRQRVLVDREIRNAIADVMKEEEAGEEMVAWKS